MDTFAETDSEDEKKPPMKPTYIKPGSNVPTTAVKEVSRCFPELTPLESRGEEGFIRRHFRNFLSNLAIFEHELITIYIELATTI